MQYEIAHNLFLHLPLNLVWRLVGLNHIVNKVLLSEHLWRVRCEREFPLLPNKINSYRLYWLMMTRRISGKLYDSDGRMMLKGVSWFDSFHLYNEEKVYLVLMNRTLYLGRGVDPYRQLQPLVNGVVSVEKLSIDYEMYLLIIDDHRRKYLKVNGEGSPEIIDHMFLKFSDITCPRPTNDVVSQRVVQAYIDNVLHYDGGPDVVNSWVLLDSGELYRIQDSQVTLFKRDIIQIDLYWYRPDTLITLSREGEIGIITPREPIIIVSDNIIYRNTTNMLGELCTFSEDGSIVVYCYKVMVGRSKKNLPLYCISRSPPIREVILVDCQTKENIIVAIDGNSFIDVRPAYHLRSDPVWIDYFGLIMHGIYGEIFAVDRRIAK